jgi:predicted  nucleic acid-binding Zn-ribbon protein
MKEELGNLKYEFKQLDKNDERLRAQDRELWREIGALQSARTFHATQIAAIDEELHALELRVTARIEGVEQSTSAKIDRVVDTIRFNIRTGIAVGAVLIALAQLVFFWLR